MQRHGRVGVDLFFVPIIVFVCGFLGYSAAKGVFGYENTEAIRWARYGGGMGVVVSVCEVVRQILRLGERSKKWACTRNLFLKK
jgi:hypothetical protein